MTNLIGKTVTVDRERFPHAENTPDALNYALPKDAAQVQISIVTEGVRETVFATVKGRLKG